MSRRKNKKSLRKRQAQNHQQTQTDDSRFRPFKTGELAAITGGTIVKQGETSIMGVITDSRKVTAGDLYIPIIGENNDGHVFISQACDNGAAAVLCQADHLDDVKSQVPDGVTLISVDKTFEAFKAIAGANRARYGIPIVAVTGSAGKTTTKDLIAAVLSQKFNTMKTQGNFNNEVGVPLTLLTLTPAHEAAVVEMGMNHMGEIARSISLVRPHIGVITNIGSAHLENLGTKDNTLKAKMEIFGTMGKDDIALLNGDDEYLNKIQDVPYQVFRVGIDGDNLDLRAENIEEAASGLTFDAGGTTFHFRLPGTHNVYNCLMAIWIGRYYGLTDQQIQRGLDAFVPSGNRMKPIKVGDIEFINDAYNANPESMRAAIDSVTTSAKGPVIGVLGDMLEIGKKTNVQHFEVGKYAMHKMAGVIAVGPLARSIYEGALSAENGRPLAYAKDLDEAVKALKDMAEPGDTVLLKASHSMALDKIVDMYKENA